MINYTALSGELISDPAVLGYAAYINSGNYIGASTLLNTTQSGVQYKIFRGVIDSYEVINNTSPTEWTALSAAEKQRYQTITGAAKVDTNNLNVRNSFLTMFSGGSVTRTNLINMAQYQGSRAEILWGTNTVINYLDVVKAIGG